MKNERLQRILKESGLTYEKAAEMIGSKPTTISGWVGGGNLENSTKFYDLCKLMQWNPVYIIEGTGEKMVNQVQEPQNNYGKNMSEVEYLKLLLNQKEILLKEKEIRISEKDEMIQMLKEKCKEVQNKDLGNSKSKAS